MFDPKDENSENGGEPNAEIGQSEDVHFFDDTATYSEQKRQAVTTLTHVVMPVYFPDLMLIQEGLGKDYLCFR